MSYTVMFFLMLLASYIAIHVPPMILLSFIGDVLQFVIACVAIGFLVWLIYFSRYSDRFADWLYFKVTRKERR